LSYATSEPEMQSGRDSAKGSHSFTVGNVKEYSFENKLKVFKSSVDL